VITSNDGFSDLYLHHPVNFNTCVSKSSLFVTSGALILFEFDKQFDMNSYISLEMNLYFILFAVDNFHSLVQQRTPSDSKNNPYLNGSLNISFYHNVAKLLEK